MKLIPTFTSKLEKLCSISPLLIKLVEIYYKDLVKREVDLGQISCDDHVLCIGGGPLPCTALAIANQTGAQVYVIDIDPLSVEIAQKVIKRLNMTQKVKVGLASGQQMDVSDFSVVHVALQAYPREDIFKNVWKKAPAGARILMRSPKEALRPFYSSLPDECHKCHQCMNIKQNNMTISCTLLFTKNQGGFKDDEKGNTGFSSPHIDFNTHMVS
ncbi:nicotianamine synthase family protein [Alkaliphilus peptidifermentans]|uniref:Nicotianamine synthase protein n=1 Tax=Alkaliphilus peptidifermentans DSM 18978 TaxID=1120976 RepID=A0A1G5L1X6_9FIRM|nr:nicotianamine synthase family protein [Alkaliphilus peptidifermentans]SCZ06885.1 Nicotianamine synthase protein [Alkaliphilus peptidifermentans DSM 18978]